MPPLQKPVTFSGMERCLVLGLVLVALGFNGVYGVTDSQDAAVVLSLKKSWRNVPPSWENSSDPCGEGWEGISCTETRITSLRLSSIRLSGIISPDIEGLSELQSLDLSFNTNLTGTLPPSIGNLKNLKTLILAGCSFIGSIPEELGNLSDLTILVLGSNYFNGEIPSSLGKLSKLYWLDLADNRLTGSIPVSPGLDQLLHAKHFFLNKNRLSGTVPPELFSSDMVLLHLLLGDNQLTGTIPPTLGQVKTLSVLRLNNNLLTGPAPSLNYHTQMNELNLANNHLTGPVPDLTGMDSLYYVDMSNNSFDSSEAPTWFSNLISLTALVFEGGSFTGPIPEGLFSAPQLQLVKLGNNSFNGTLDMGNSISSSLELVDLQFNNISSLSSAYNYTLLLYGNPICSHAPNLRFCQQQPKKPYSTSLSECGNKTCPSDQKLNPQSCNCAYPYEGNFIFRAPVFQDLSNSTAFQSLEKSLWTQLNLTTGSVSLQNPYFNNDDYLRVETGLFPSQGMYFDQSEVQRIGFALASHTFKPPTEFGPYYFIPSSYNFTAYQKLPGIIR
ncbi:hypothetical protein H6P81_014785 [Aristolochia fimbriata]|uniref:Leucine-rich repeat-containing N-terminal plant-type domain-containing protein n=1 Tax=Aristolochia fimbriata TaxID=158543 RepID=A0AAV7E3E7_ARIFI|nr:hypothetical protein H6P81_014785 [Aristolochia fimbriata]